MSRMFNRRNVGVACGVCFIVCIICYDFFKAEQQLFPWSAILGGDDVKERGGGGGIHTSMIRAGDVKNVSHHDIISAGHVNDASDPPTTPPPTRPTTPPTHPPTQPPSTQPPSTRSTTPPTNHKDTSHNIIMHTSGMNVEFERLINETAAQLVGETAAQLVEWLPPRELPILDHDQLLRAVARSPQDLNGTTIVAPTAPKDYYNTTPTLGLYRLARVISDLEAGKKKHIQVLVIGGSMTAGHGAGGHPGAWSRKLEILLQALWGPESITVKNIARPAVQYDYWMQNFASIVEFGHFDIVIGDFAVNDQVDYDKQDERAIALNKVQYHLLNQLVHLPFRPVVLLVETFLTASTNEGDARVHCGKLRKKVDTQWICPQWWMPQTMREQAVRFNSVPIVSYRDAVWPLHNFPPTNIEYYWDGRNHPHFNAHVMMAEALLFGFLAVRRNAEDLKKKFESSDFPVPKLPPPDDVCFKPKTEYFAENGNNDTSRFPGWNSPKDSHCWQYRADSRDKFGWIAETSKKSTLCSDANHSALFQVNMDDVGKKGIAILSYLVSYDVRMASARVWIADENGKPLSSNYTISSWHKEQTSLEATAILRVPKRSIRTTVNVELLAGTSLASKKDSENGVDKFKLLGLRSC